MPRQRIEQLGGVGLMSDPIPSTLAPNAWTSMRNVATDNGAIRSVRGETKLFDLAIKPIYHTAYVAPSGLWSVVVSDGKKVYLYEIVARTGVEITPSGADFTGGPISFTNLNGILICNSATDGAFYYDSGAALPADRILKPLPGWDTGWRCRTMVAFRYFLVALNMTEDDNAFPHKLRWSNSAQEGDLPAEWVAAISNDAGDDLLGETAGVIVGGTVVRDQLYIVKEDAIYSMSWIGGEYVMRTDRLKGGVGTRLDRGFAQMKGGLVVFTTADVLFFDGQNSTSLVDGRIRNTIKEEISEELWEFSQVFVNPSTSQLSIAGVSAGYRQLTSALTFNYEENTWGLRKLNYGYGFDLALVAVSANLPTWDELDGTSAYSNAYPRMVPGKTWDQQNDGSWNKGIYQPSEMDVLVYESNDADSAWWVSVIALSDSNSDGSPKYCAAERIGIPIEGADGLAMITELWPEIVSTIPVQISVGGMAAENSTPYWDGPYTVTPGVTNSITPRVTGRFMCIRIESQDIGQWTLGAMTYNWERAGER